MSIKINLKGPDGNAYALLGYAKSWGKQVMMHEDVIKDITTRMTSGDYNNLLKVFHEEFGTVMEYVNAPKDLRL